MRLSPWLQVFVNAAAFVIVSGRLGNGELELPRAFGEAVLKSANAETLENPDSHPSILLTEASLHTLGSSVNDETSQSEVVADPGLKQVCEHTSAALSAQSTGDLPNGRVYKECMAALAPLRDHEKDSDAVDTLSDCMALVNALVAAGAKGNVGSSLCSAAVVGTIDTVPKAKHTPAPTKVLQPTPVVHAALAKTPSKKAVTEEAVDAVELVTEAMSAVCTETVHDAETGLKSETDAVKLAGAIAPICQGIAEKKLGSSAASQSLMHEWCHQLDGRLTVALETGFFFALFPDEAERQAKEENPYASTTRRKFCERFVKSLRNQAQNGSLYLGAPTHPRVAAEPSVLASPPKPMPLPVLPAVPKAEPQLASPPKPMPLPVLPIVPKAAPQLASPPKPMPRPVLPVVPKAEPKLAPKQPRIAPTQPTQASVMAPSPPPVIQQSIPAQADTTVEAAQQQEQKHFQNSPLHSGVDMINLVQTLTMRDEWNQACTGLLGRLTSEEGAVTEESMLGEGETPEGAKVLTFNAVDQGQIRKCGAQLKILAIQAGIPGSASTKRTSGLVSTGVVVGASLEAAEDAETIMDSPWAEDACNDIAHGYLTAHVAHPGLRVQDFCPIYARDIQAMRSAKPTAKELEERANQEKRLLRKKGAKDSLHRRVAQASSTKQEAGSKQPVLRAAALAATPPVKHAPTALITPKQPSTEAKDEEQEGMDFWRDMLQ